MRYWLVVPAAGTGQRFGEKLPKQYAPLAGRTVIEWALAPFNGDSRCAGIAVALAADDRWWPRISENLPAVTAVPGGAERSESVRSALSALSRRASADDWVLVHDAARPCLSRKDLDRLVSEVSSHPTGGLLAVPVAETLKRGDANRLVAGTVERTGLWRAQTPQMFRYGRLCAALDQALGARRFPTDEAQALEWMGDQPLLVEGSPGNLKITLAEDLIQAAALLGAGSGSA
jgi:2-C-methyl-D-erythritol 4-phosphate cytidylyltransferase